MMLEASRRVHLYKEALQILKDPKWLERDTYVHDYDTECYRTDKGYTLNGLHWGYPDAIVETVTGENPQGFGPSGFLFATWVSPELKAYADNSRFSVVKYGDIKAIVEKGIRQKLAKAQRDDRKEKALFKEWVDVALKHYRAFKAYTLRIETHKKGTLDFIILKPSRFVRKGLEVFLEDIKPGEVSISKRAYNLLTKVPLRSGPMAIEFFGATPEHGPVIAGLFSDPLYEAVPLSAMSAGYRATDSLYARLHVGNPSPKLSEPQKDWLVRIYRGTLPHTAGSPAMRTCDSLVRLGLAKHYSKGVFLRLTPVGKEIARRLEAERS